MDLTFRRWIVTQTNRLSVGRAIYGDDCMPIDAELSDIIRHAVDDHDASQDWLDDLWDAFAEYLELRGEQHV